jgi:hypothetical protein
MPTKASPATIRTVPKIAGKSLIVIASSSLPPFVQKRQRRKKTEHGKQVKVAGWDLRTARCESTRD